MSEGSRRSRVTITLGRTGQIVNRDLDSSPPPRVVGTKRSVKERLGNQLDNTSKRHRGEESFSGNDLQISQNDLRFKLLQKRAQSDGGCTTTDLREKLSSRNEHQQTRSLDSRPRKEEYPLPPPPRRMLSPRSSYSPWALDDIRQRPPERFVDSSRMTDTPRALSPPLRNPGRMIGVPRDLSPQRSGGRIIGGPPRDLSPPRSGGRIIGGRPRDLSPPRNASRDLSPRRNASRIIGNPRDISPPRNSRSFNNDSRAPSQNRNVGSYMGSSSRGLSPVRSSGSYSRGLSPVRNSGSYMDSSRGGLSPARSYMGSSRGSPPPRNMEGYHGRSRMLHDDVRPSPYTVPGVLNRQVPTSSASFPRPMLPPPVPNPHPLPPLSQLPPLGTTMRNNPFHVLQQVEEPLTVDSFLNSLGLGKYSLSFKREEVDMTTIKQMKESDLKDLIIPMGPRKKILEAIASLPKS